MAATAPKTTILITGANTGLGLEVVRALFKSPAKRAYDVVLCGRSLDKARAAAAQIEGEFPGAQSSVTPLQVDVGSDESIERAGEWVAKERGRLDVLVNNAGATFDNQIRAEGGTLAAMRRGFGMSWDTNVTGTHILTHVLAPYLIKSARPRLLFMTSGLSSMSETVSPPEIAKGLPSFASPPAGWPKDASATNMSYRSAKAGLNMLMREWVRVLGNDGVKVHCVSPGLLATGLGGDQEFLKKIGAKHPSVGAEFVVRVVEGERDEDVGRVVRNQGVIQGW